VDRSPPEEKSEPRIPERKLTPEQKAKEDEIAVSRTYKVLAKNYHFSFEQVRNLTTYQIYYYVILLPEEEQELAEMDAALQRHHPGQPPLSRPIVRNSNPNVKHFNTPEEYEMWRAGQNKK
jgi:hypothetical protein